MDSCNRYWVLDIGDVTLATVHGLVRVSLSSIPYRKSQGRLIVWLFRETAVENSDNGRYRRLAQRRETVSMVIFSDDTVHANS